jgi:hypothetical protein
VSAATNPVNLERARAEKTISGLDDEMLVFAMLGMLSRSNEDRTGAFLVGGQSEKIAIYTRVLFGEIASRWIPSDVLAPAAAEFFGEDEADDAS